MRLDILEHGHRTRARLFMGTLERLSRTQMADITKTLLYRPDFYGRPVTELAAVAMRGPSYWTAGEREYIAMYTARLHACDFCFDSHRELTRIASEEKIDPADPGTLRPELLAVLPLLEKVTRSPESVGPGDVAKVREAGVPDTAIVEALHVNLLWNVVNRVANAFGFELREGQLEAGTKSLHRFGYRFPGFVMR